MTDRERATIGVTPEAPQAYFTPFGRLSAMRLRLPDWDGFNGALIPSQGKTLAVYRTTRDHPSLASCYLDEDLRAIPGSHHRLPLYRNADPRLIEFQGEVHLVTSYFGAGFDRERVELRKLTPGDQGIELGEVVAKFDQIDNDPTYKKRREKNWAPFVNEGALYFVHRMRPHRVLRYDAATQRVVLVAQAPWSLPDIWPPEWRGELRLNANPVRLDERKYLSTFHSYVPGRGYFNGFYLFDDRPPFPVLRLSARPVTYPADATGSNPHSQRSGVLFFQSLLVDHDQQTVRLAGGDNDHSVVAIDFELNDVLAEMVPVKAPAVPGDGSGPVLFDLQRTAANQAQDEWQNL